VIATASGGDDAYLESIGASRVIDYRAAQFEKVLREKVDVVFDLIGGDTQKRSFLVLKKGGYLVAATQPVSPEETAKHGVSGAMMRLAPSADNARQDSRDCWKKDDTTRRRDRVRARGRGPGLEGHRRELASGSWDVARCAGSGTTQITRQDRAACSLAARGTSAHFSAARCERRTSSW